MHPLIKAESYLNIYPIKELCNSKAMLFHDYNTWRTIISKLWTTWTRIKLCPKTKTLMLSLYKTNFIRSLSTAWVFSRVVTKCLPEMNKWGNVTFDRNWFCYKTNAFFNRFLSKLWPIIKMSTKHIMEWIKTS